VCKWVVLSHQDSRASKDSARLISGALSRVCHLTADGLKACLNVVDAYDNEDNSLLTGFICQLLESMYLLPADERALKSMVAVLEVPRWL